VQGGSTDPCGDSGAVLESYFPYTASMAPCNCPYPHDYFIDDWAYVGPVNGVATVDQIKQAIIDYGPVSVAVSAGGFSGYSGGIFSHASNSINHAVALVGWDDNQGSNGVWFLRNSWGTGWGEGGYMRIEYGANSVGYRTVRVNYPGFTNDPPYAPFNPDPEDEEIMVDKNADLIWDCFDPNGNPLTYDVYFGMTNPPPLISSGQSEKTYNPGQMSLYKTYYWKIVAEDNHAASTGSPIWSFTIGENDPPYTPSDPDPEDGERDIDINADLSWTSGSPNGKVHS